MEAKLKAYRLLALHRRNALLQNKCVCKLNNANMNTPEDQILLLAAESVVNEECPDCKKQTTTLDIKEDITTIAPKPNQTEYVFREEKVNSWAWLLSKWGISLAIWLVFYYFFLKIEFGAVFVVISGLVFIYFNTRTGPKQEGEVSAYSVFNEGCRNIDGTFTAEQLEQELRYGPMINH